MVPEPALAPDVDESLRRRLAEFGVPLFHPAPPSAPSAPTETTLADLVRALALSDDSRLRAAIPCLLATQEGRVCVGALARAAGADARLRERLGYVYRLARALVVSRAPDLERLLGRTEALPPSALEPSDLPDPSVLAGEMTLFEASARARDERVPDVAGGVERMFDTWLRLLAVDRAAARR